MIREQRGVTQAELAFAIGKSRQAVCHWENDPALERAWAM
jgi:DNA-binding XRE family transcriptional regulator